MHRKSRILFSGRQWLKRLWTGFSAISAWWNENSFSLLTLKQCDREITQDLSDPRQLSNCSSGEMLNEWTGGSWNGKMRVAPEFKAETAIRPAAKQSAGKPRRENGHQLLIEASREGNNMLAVLAVNFQGQVLPFAEQFLVFAPELKRLPGHK